MTLRSCLPVLALSMLPVSADAALVTTAPGETCALLKDVGLATRGWKNQYEDQFGCSSPYKEIGTAFPLANNLAYYVEGGPTTASRAKLVLNVNDRESAVPAHDELLKAAQILSAKVIGIPLPSEIAAAIAGGTSLSKSAGRATVEVLRTDWPTGKGYEVKIVFE